MPKSATVKPVSTDPEVTLEKEVPTEIVGREEPEEMVTVMIDKDMTDGGLRVNGKLYVGNVKVPKDQAEDMLRMQEEYFETKKKLTDPQIHVRMKSDFQKEVLFLADPDQNAMKRGWTRDYGLLGVREWGYCSPVFKEHLLEQRKQLYGY